MNRLVEPVYATFMPYRCYTSCSLPVLLSIVYFSMVWFLGVIFYVGVSVNVLIGGILTCLRLQMKKNERLLGVQLQSFTMRIFLVELLVQRVSDQVTGIHFIGGCLFSGMRIMIL